MLDTLTQPIFAPTVSPAPTFSVVVPVFNEEPVIRAFHERLSAVMERLGDWEAVYVNDGSRDATLAILQALRRGDPRFAIVNLSRNFGKEIATTAGLDHARGDAVIVIDADLQDPPELIPELVAAWREGYDIAYAQRREREGESWLKRASARGFYTLMQYVGRAPIPADTGDFRLMSRRVVDAVLQMREHHRFMKGLFAWVGYPAKAVLYDRAARQSGGSKWSYWRLWNLAIEGVTGFTLVPLKIATYLGLFVAACAALYAAEVIIKTLIFGNPVAGYPSLMTVVLFLGGVQLITLGVIGEYLGRIFNETKNRPLYWVERYIRSQPHAPGPQ
ncbi:MAG: glycosyltransferase family 2 protein [Acetobacteraceae bacterium]|nr:glycosyltransferase family 2 protein [Acetobacteraceae bacterium]MBV8522389.1 glycosyltransferase family 2 protein [Acetobacteraceae bacterium]MBV8590796.1 glycosyltransferase family 2 protein [Acetobacteraceae bacterium]